jgi:hypothetical protein
MLLLRNRLEKSLGVVKKIDERNSSMKWMKYINTLLCVCAISMIVAHFFSKEIADHRMQAMSFIIGIALVLWGIDIIVKKDFVYPIKIFKKKSVIKKEGKAAKIIGGIIAILGAFLSIWGLLFWINFLRNI